MAVIAALFGLVAFVCWILVLVAAFKNSDIVLGVVGIICPLVIFIMGWVKSAEWNVQKIMLVWTIATILGTIFNVIAAGSAASGA